MQCAFLLKVIVAQNCDNFLEHCIIQLDLQEFGGFWQIIARYARIQWDSDSFFITEMLTYVQVNQIGSVSESIEAVKMSKQAGWGVMTSHRSGETEDTFIADLAVGLCTVNSAF